MIPTLTTGTKDAAERGVTPGADAPTGGRAVGQQLFTTAWCAVGGERGGELVPRWFSVLPELGIRHVRLFWAVPESADSAAALDHLRSLSGRWLAELNALGIEGDLAIKRGAPGPWLAGVAAMSPDSLVVVGPPSDASSASGTIAYLVEEATTPVLFLPELQQPPEGRFLARPVVGVGPDPTLGPLLQRLLGDGAEPHLLDLHALAPLEKIRTALRIAEDVDGSLLVLPHGSADLVPYALRHGSFPLLLALPTSDRS